MKTFSLNALALGIAVSLSGCAPLPLTQSIQAETFTALQPVDVKIGIRQPELYANYVRSTAGTAGTAGCAAIPGLGVLLAAACGGAFGAMDASINAARAQEADEKVRPLKDLRVDTHFDQSMRNALVESMQATQAVRIADVVVTKTVTEKAYEDIFSASVSPSVMFVNIEYYLSPDFSMLELTSRSMLYPRSAAAKEAARLPTAPAADKPAPVLAQENASYRANFFYRARLPVASADTATNIEAWRADDGRLLRAALHHGIQQTSHVLREDLHARTTAASAATDIDLGNGQRGSLVFKSEAGMLARDAAGSLYFEADVADALRTHEVAQASAPVAGAASAHAGDSAPR
ncbi:MAG: hypothetical protein LBI66_05965 [Burkholderiaceae bacterium]|nr:hypothetical protein [Burkholderiaceae bacterium]